VTEDFPVLAHLGPMMLDKGRFCGCCNSCSDDLL